MARYGILIDLDRCIGCRTHEVVCQQEGNATVRQDTLSICRTNAEGKKVLRYLPVVQERCSTSKTCTQRVKEHLSPRCIGSCPAQARKFGKVEELVDYVTRRRIPHTHLIPF